MGKHRYCRPRDGDGGLSVPVLQVWATDPSELALCARIGSFERAGREDIEFHRVAGVCSAEALGGRGIMNS